MRVKKKRSRGGDGVGEAVLRVRRVWAGDEGKGEKKGSDEAWESMLRLCAIGMCAVFFAAVFVLGSGGGDFEGTERGGGDHHGVLEQETIEREMHHVHRTEHVACAAPETATQTGSYAVRCTLLSVLMTKYGTGHFVIVPTTFEAIDKDAYAKYDATIALKTVPPDSLAPKLGRQYVDIVDAFDISADMVPLRTRVIVQSAFQRAQWKSSPSHAARVIEHLPTYINGTEAEYTPPPLTDGRALTALTVSEWTPVGACFDVHSPLFRYDCLTSTSWDREHLFEDSIGISNVTAYMGTSWGIGWLYTQLFRSYDCVVVYNKPGDKLRSGAIQRMTNPMQAGVLTLVESHGVHTEYVGDSYACAFDDRASLEALLSALAIDAELRDACRAQATAMLREKGLGAAQIIAKYEALLSEPSPVIPSW